jgi:tripartite-type tricarboxylate transporter receptor subunit TctC
VARAAPDGHTVLIAHVGQLAVSQHLYRDLPYDPVQDFAPVGLICTNPMALLVSVRSGISGLEELRARAREGRLRIATSGTGTTLHLGALQFLSAVGGRADLIPYRGGGPATNDLIAGTVDMLIEQALSAIPTHQGGRARALVVTGPARLAEMPEVPTAAEAGLPGLDVEVWNGLVLPRGAPERVVAAHAAALEVALADETVRSRFARFSGRLPGEGERGPAHFARKIHAESERWGRLLREAGVERQG